MSQKSDEERAADLQKRLEKALKYDPVDNVVVRDMLGALSGMAMSVALLTSTKVGRTVNSAAKDSKLEAQTRKLAEEIVVKWKSLVPVSSRASSRPKKEVSYAEPTEQQVIAAAENERAKEVKAAVSGSKVTVYKERKSPPKRLPDGTFSFPDYPKFRPNLSPAEVLRAGSFGGTYFRPIKSKVTGILYGSEPWEELPKDWLEGIDIKRKIVRASYDASVNTYKVKCGASLDEWESSGWIRDSDPYGWFQWYCRFFQGRRCDDDDRQVGRGLACMGATGRWRTNLLNKIIAGQGKRSLQQALDDHNISPVIRQTLQHWGYRPSIADLEDQIKRKFG